MKTRLYSIILLVFALGWQLEAQRYLAPTFGVNYTPDVAYGANITIITGSPTVDTLLMDVYSPIDTSNTAHPVILIAHTGSFLPPLFNGQVTGSRYDSTVTYMAKALASMGYVVGAYTYRQGWLPTAPDEDQRRSTLLQAAYRGIQDTRTCVRYFRRNAAEAGNQFNIDPDKIGVVGIGTGGYLALGAGSLHDFSEVELDKFINTQTALPYIDSTVVGNLYATTQAAICLPNHPGYSSDIDFSFNLGGALGDVSWLDGEEREPAYSGVHCVNDIFAPYHVGPVIVPTTNEFVVNVAGTRAAIEAANTLGSNEILASIEAQNDPLRPLIEVQKQTDVTLLTTATIKMGTDNFYGFNLPVPQGSPWDWWDLNTLRQVVDFVNGTIGTDFNADTLHASGLATNPGMSPEQGRRYMDTIFTLMLPRACAALNLGCFTVAIEDLTAEEVGLEIAPNPAISEMTIRTEKAFPIESIYLYDINGRLVLADVDQNTNSYQLNRNSNMASGVYFLKIMTTEGQVNTKVSFQ